MDRPSVTSRMFSSLPWLARVDHQALQGVARARTCPALPAAVPGRGRCRSWLLEQVDGIQRQHQRGAVGEVDDVQHAVNQRQAERDQRIDRARGQAVEQRREKDPEFESSIFYPVQTPRSLRRLRPNGGCFGFQWEDRVDLAVVARHDHLDVVLELTCVISGCARVFWPLTNLVGPYGMMWSAKLLFSSASMMAARSVDSWRGQSRRPAAASRCRS